MGILGITIWTTIFVAAFGSIVLTADVLLRRKIARSMKLQWTGSLLTRVRTAYTWQVQGSTVTQVEEKTKAEQLITPRRWWKCILPWPGKRKWAETVQAKAALLGATIEYQAVSAWDWDEAWVIEIDADNIIASSNRTATALAFLIYKGVDSGD